LSRAEKARRRREEEERRLARFNDGALGEVDFSAAVDVNVDLESDPDASVSVGEED
jgi:hypothetical protein